jgi:Enoyl-(Acyl carrier protein) reductase
VFLTFEGTRDAKLRDRDTRVKIALSGHRAGRLGRRLRARAGCTVEDEAPRPTSDCTVVDMITRCGALELGGRGIRVVGIAPGLVETPLTRRELDDPATRALFMGVIPMQRTVDPQETADTAEVVGTWKPTRCWTHQLMRDCGNTGIGTRIALLWARRFNSWQPRLVNWWRQSESSLGAAG